jgi:hypothetical protein
MGSGGGWAAAVELTSKIKQIAASLDMSQSSTHEGAIRAAQSVFRCSISARLSASGRAVP